MMSLRRKVLGWPKRSIKVNFYDLIAIDEDAAKLKERKRMRVRRKISYKFVVLKD